MNTYAAMSKGNRKTKVCIVTTVDSSLYVLFPGFFQLLQEQGFEVTGICSEGPWLAKVRDQGIRVIVVPMTRNFTPLADSICLWKLYQAFRQERFDLIHYSTPKAAFLAGLAGRMARCPALLYTLRGLGYAAFGGFKRAIGKLCEKIACKCAHSVIAISNSLKDEAVREQLIAASQINVLGEGSSKGVDLDEFQPNVKTSSESRRIRQSLGIADGDVVIGYVGRLTEEKGIAELVKVVNLLQRKYANLHLVMVGHTDQRNPFTKEIFDNLSEKNHIHVIPFTDDLPNYLAAMDIVVLVSHREGFGNSLIEASAMEIPVIASDIIGCRDAVVDNVTGLLVKPYDMEALERNLDELITNPAKRTDLGRSGRKWVEKNFDRHAIWAELITQYKRLLQHLHETGRHQNRAEF